MDLVWDGIREAVRILITGDEGVWEITFRSLYISGSATAIALVLGIGAGALLAFRRFPGRNLAVTLVNTGMGLPPVVVGLIVAVMLWRSGPFGQLHLIYTPGAMIIAQVVIATPLVTGFSLAALGALPPRLRPQLYALGASRLQMLWLVLIEARLPLFAAIMAGFGAAVSEVGASLMVGGNLAGDTRVLTTAVVLEVSKGNLDVAMALSFILLVLILLVVGVLTTVQQRERRS
ncbi:MAG: ABC transporter permease [Dehalococcoidia bacterium]